MYLIETVLGSVADPRWQRRLSGCAIDLLRLSQWDAQKNRLRRESSGGIPLAIALERGQSLHDGDILFWDAAARLAVVCELALCEVLALDLRGLCALPPLQLAVRALALGHALGNQHWPAVQNDGMVYVPVTVSRDVVSAVLKTHHFDDIPHRFLPGRTVAEHLGPELARRLFGGGEQHKHHHACDHAPAGTHHGHSAETRDHDGTGHHAEACGHDAGSSRVSCTTPAAHGAPSSASGTSGSGASS